MDIMDVVVFALGIVTGMGALVAYAGLAMSTPRQEGVTEGARQVGFRQR